MTDEAGADLGFAGGTFDLDASSAITGAGTVSFESGTVNDAGRYTATATNVLPGATANLAGAVTMPALTMSGGTLTGFSTLTVTGPLTWIAGTLSGGTITAKGGMTLGVTDADYNEILSGATLNNQGAATLANLDGSTGLELANGALFDNEAGASFTFLASELVYSDGSQTTFNNEGTVSQSSGVAGSSAIGTAFDQSATGGVDVEGGTLSFGDGGTITGSMTAEAGADLGFDGGTFNLDASSAITGAGTVSFGNCTVNDAGRYGAGGGTVVDSAGTADLTGTITDLGAGITMSGGAGTLALPGAQFDTIPALTMIAGTLTGFAALTVTGPFNWTGGTIGGGTITSQGALTLGGANGEYTEVLSAATLDNQGAATLANADSSGGLSLTNGAVFDNQANASFTFLTSTPVASDGSSGTTFRNEGVVAQSAAATGTSTISCTFQNAAKGSFSVQGGSLFLNGAVASAPAVLSRRRLPEPWSSPAA